MVDLVIIFVVASVAIISNIKFNITAFSFEKKGEEKSPLPYNSKLE